MFDADLLAAIRGRFAHVESCPFQGERIFLENAGGALTLNAVVQTSARLAAIPDNLGRDNPGAQGLNEILLRGRADMRTFFGAAGGEVIVGESGTELLFRVLRVAALATGTGGQLLGSTLEHPASRSAAAFWAGHTGAHHRLIVHDNATGTIGVDDYLAQLEPSTRVATIIHTSPLTGMDVDIASIAAAIRARAPQCFIIVDGIQHAAHGAIELADTPIDAYVISPYKVFSRHGYGIAWLSDRLANCAHEKLIGSPATQWELGTRDVGAFATFSDVVDYLDWLGARQPDGAADDRATRLRVAGRAITAHETALVALLLEGQGALTGLAGLPGVTVIGGARKPERAGLVSFVAAGHEATDIVSALNARGIRTHVRKNDHYSGNVLEPLGLDACVRVSMCHYNSAAEIEALLAALGELLG